MQLKVWSIYCITAFLTPLPLIHFTTEEITGYNNEAAKDADKAPRNPSSYFTVSVIPSINILESSNDFMVLIISFISSFKTNKVNPLPALTAPFPLIFLSNLFIGFEVKFLTNPGNLSLSKGIATFLSVFLSYIT